MSKLFNGVLFVFIAAILYSYNGFALSVLWEWFIVTGFNAPSISIPTAIGIALIVNFLTNKPKKDNDTSNSDFLEGIVYVLILGILTPTLALAIGWVVTLFM